MDVKRYLLPGSIPTIQKPSRVADIAGSSTATSIFTVTTAATTTVTQSQAVCSSITTVTSVNLKTPVCSTSTLKGVTRVRGAYQKRERQRVRMPKYFFMF